MLRLFLLCVLLCLSTARAQQAVVIEGPSGLIEGPIDAPEPDTTDADGRVSDWGSCRVGAPPAPIAVVPDGEIDIRVGDDLRGRLQQIRRPEADGGGLFVEV